MRQTDLPHVPPNVHTRSCLARQNQALHFELAAAARHASRWLPITSYYRSELCSPPGSHRPKGPRELPLAPWPGLCCTAEGLHLVSNQGWQVSWGSPRRNTQSLPLPFVQAPLCPAETSPCSVVACMINSHMSSMLHRQKWKFAMMYQKQKPPKLTGIASGQEKRWGTEEETKRCSFLPTSLPAICFVGMLSTLTLRDTKGHDEALERGYDGHIRGICPHLLNLKALER